MGPKIKEIEIERVAELLAHLKSLSPKKKIEGS